MRRLGGILLLLLPLFLVAQCGLEWSIEVWSPPTPATLEPSFTFAFNTKTDHVDDIVTPSRLFLGYELYYKIKSVDSFPDNLKDASELALNGFRRLHLSTDTWSPDVQVTDPVISTGEFSVGEGIAYKIDLNFGNIYDSASEPSAYVDDSAPMPYWGPLELKRDVQDQGGPDNFGKYKRFYEFWPGDNDIDPSDTDLVNAIASAAGTANPVNVHIAIYVFAYGKSLANTSLWQDIKSELCYLTSRQINIYVSAGD